MRLTDHTDYTMRVLMYCAANEDRLVTIPEIAATYSISRGHLMKIVHELGKNGVLDTLRGRGGGLRLAKPPHEIRIGPIIRQSEPDFALVECFEPTKNQCCLTPRCALKGVLARALDAYFQSLENVTLADITEPRRGTVSPVQTIKIQSRTPAPRQASPRLRRASKV